MVVRKPSDGRIYTLLSCKLSLVQTISSRSSNQTDLCFSDLSSSMSRRRLLSIHSLCGKDFSFSPTSAFSLPCNELELPSPEPFHHTHLQYLHTVGHGYKGTDWKAACELSFGSCHSHQRRQLFGEGIPANHHHERKLLG